MKPNKTKQSKDQPILPQTHPGFLFLSKPYFNLSGTPFGSPSKYIQTSTFSHFLYCAHLVHITIIISQRINCSTSLTGLPPSTFDPFHLFSPSSLSDPFKVEVISCHSSGQQWLPILPREKPYAILACTPSLTNSLSTPPPHSFHSGSTGFITVCQTCQDHFSFQPLYYPFPLLGKLFPKSLLAQLALHGQ